MPSTLPSAEPRPSPTIASTEPETVVLPWWISYPSNDRPASHDHAGGRRPNRTAVHWVVLPGRYDVATGSRPRPSADPSTPAGSLIAPPSICRPPQIPSTGRPDAAALMTASAMPHDRIQARSLGTCLEPGSTTRSAPASAAGVRAQRTSATCWSRTNSSRLEAYGPPRMHTRRLPPLGAPSVGPSSSGSACSIQGTTPTVGTPVTCSSSAGAGASRPTSPRNLLSRNPQICDRQGGGSSAQVP